jgi:hypothetical protein
VLHNIIWPSCLNHSQQDNAMQNCKGEWRVAPEIWNSTGKMLCRFYIMHCLIFLFVFRFVRFVWFHYILREFHSASYNLIKANSFCTKVGSSFVSLLLFLYAVLRSCWRYNDVHHPRTVSRIIETQEVFQLDYKLFLQNPFQFIVQQ